MTVTTNDADQSTDGSSSSAPILVVSCDTHIGPRLDEELRPHCPAALLDQFDAYSGVLKEKRDEAAARGKKLSFGATNIGQQFGVMFANLDAPGHYDPVARMRDLDSDGVAAEVIFHDSQNGEPIPFQADSMLLRGSGVEQDFDLLRAGQRIYNSWLAEVCSEQPERHIGLMHLPMWDPEAAIEELKWARSVGLKGINFPTPKPFMTPYTAPVWDDFFAVAADLGVTLCNHGGAASTGGTYPGAMSIAKLEISMMARLCPLDHLIFGGVFERHPGLRFVITESPGNWWRFVLGELDGIYLTDTEAYGPTEKERVPLTPTEYASRQVWIGASFQSPNEARTAVAEDYADRVIWGSDYPHFEGTFQYNVPGPNGEPMTWAAQRYTYGGLPEDKVRAMLGGNALNAYDLDGDALGKVAARINAPSYDDLNAVKVETRPEGGGHLAFRTGSSWN